MKSYKPEPLIRVSYRISREHDIKLKKMSQKMKLTLSGVIRSLIESYEHYNP